MKTIKPLLAVVYFSILSMSSTIASSNLCSESKWFSDYIEIDSLPLLVTNCPFSENNNSDGFITDEEYEIMNFCYENRITDPQEISNHILGNWELVGHGEGWVPTISQPCITIEVTETLFNIKYIDSSVDTLTSHEWELQEGQNGAYLEFSPAIDFGSGFGIICSEYMYSNFTISDGNMYLYKKNPNISTSNYTFDKDSDIPIEIFPIPSSGLIEIRPTQNSQKIENIQVYNLLGAIVSFEYDYKSESLIILDLSNKIPGSYFLVIDQNGKRSIQKVILL